MTEVLIIGGGIGGLCLAHGLRQASDITVPIKVTVFERTTERTDWLQGYRIHINPHGSSALHACLPSKNWRQFVDTVSFDDAAFAFVTEQGKTLLELDAELINPNADPAQRHHGVSRIKLREALLSGLDDCLRLGKQFERYELTPEGRVTAHFSDGTCATGDLLIGADGANSLVRKQLLPHAERVDTGVIAIAGKHYDRRSLAPELANRVKHGDPAGTRVAVHGGVGGRQPRRRLHVLGICRRRRSI
jgi:salicylate hydroxylase